VDKPDQQRDFFVSYTQADRAWAEWIAWQLEAERYTTVLQEWDFRPGENFVVRMRDALQGASRTIAVLSAGYLASNTGLTSGPRRSCTTPTAARGCCPCESRRASCRGYLPPWSTSTLWGSTGPPPGDGCWRV
jgi:hypothetical protein